MKGRRAALVTLGIAAGLIAAVVGLRGPYARFLAWHWKSRLATVPDDRAGTLVEGVARLGEPGIPVLVEALGSERESVAQAGRRVLWDEMRRWEGLRARDYSPKLAILAKALADRVGEFGPAARVEAAAMASQILRLWTLDDRAIDPTQVIASCERVLRKTGPPGALLAGQSNVERPDQVAREHLVLDPWVHSRPGLRPPGDLSALTGGPIGANGAPPGGGIPIEELEARSPTDGSGPLRLAEGPPPEPRQLIGRGEFRPLRQHAFRRSEGNDLAENAERDAAPAREEGLADLPPGRALDYLSQESAPANGGQDGQSPPSRLAGLDTVDLMRRLQSPEHQAVEEALAELARRGFTETHLALARQMFDPDPKVRARLARAVLQTPGVDAAPWLLQLSQDEDPDVRLAAIGLMATTGDPSLWDAVEAAARQDTDPRVQRQAEQIASQRRGPGR
jgi:hypothetical protein